MEKEKTCKIVFSDIDGTLLTSYGQITEGTKEMILNLEKKGIPFILTSARSPEGVRVIKRMLGNHAPIIGESSGKRKSWDFRLKLDLLKIHLKQKAEFINFSSWEIRT